MDTIRQLSIFLENKQGVLYRVLNILTENGINIKALSLGDASEFAILRLIVEEPEKTKELLTKKDYVVKITNVLAIELLDEPGGLTSVLKILHDGEIDLDYLYAFTQGTPQKAILIFHVIDLEKVKTLFKENNVRILSEEDICNL